MSKLCEVKVILDGPAFNSHISNIQVNVFICVTDKFVGRLILAPLYWKHYMLMPIRVVMILNLVSALLLNSIRTVNVNSLPFLIKIIIARKIFKVLPLTWFSVKILILVSFNMWWVRIFMDLDVRDIKVFLELIVINQARLRCFLHCVKHKEISVL